MSVDLQLQPNRRLAPVPKRPPTLCRWRLNFNLIGGSPLFLRDHRLHCRWTFNFSLIATFPLPKRPPTLCRWRLNFNLIGGSPLFLRDHRLHVGGGSTSS